MVLPPFKTEQTKPNQTKPIKYLYNEAPTMTLAELKKAAKTRNFVVRKDGDEIEIYPKGRRGDQSYFGEDTADMFATMNINFEWSFEKGFDGAAAECPVFQTEEIKDAFMDLCKRYHGKWMEKLRLQWMRGQKVSSTSEQQSWLQRVRNFQAPSGSPQGNGLAFAEAIQTHMDKA